MSFNFIKYNNKIKAKIFRSINVEEHKLTLRFIFIKS